MPAFDVDFEMTQAEVSLVDATADDNLRADRQFKILTVETDGSCAIGEEVDFIPCPFGDVTDQGDVSVILVDIVAGGDDPAHGGQVIGGRRRGVRGDRGKCEQGRNGEKAR